jgi:hypothetical protein
MKRWHIPVVGVAVAIVAATSAMGVGAALKRALGLNIGTGNGIGAVKIATNDAMYTTNAQTFTTVPGEAVNIPVGAGQSVIITADYSASTSCYPTGPGSAPSAAGQIDVCNARIVIGGIEGYPQAGGAFGFDSSDGGTEGFISWEGHEFSRSRRIANTSNQTQNYSVYVQVATSDPGTSLSLQFSHLRVMAVSNGTGL